jgi:hypothetical protein
MIHIGSLIEKKIKEKGKLKKWVAAEMGMSRDNLNDIFKKQSINSEQLTNFCRVIGHDFFKDLAETTGQVNEPTAKYGENDATKIKFVITDDPEGIVDSEFMDALNAFIEFEDQRRKKKKQKK